MSNFKIELKEPEVVDGKEIKELEFREPRGSDMEDFLGEIVTEDGKPKVGKGVTGLATRCIVSHSLSEDDIRAFSAKNYMQVATRFMGFIK